MSQVDTVATDPGSLPLPMLFLGKDHFLGRGEHNASDMANAFSTRGCLIISEVELLADDLHYLCGMRVRHILHQNQMHFLTMAAG